MNLKKKALLFVVFALAAAATGCSPSSPPAIRLEVGGEVISGLQSAYCWDRSPGGTLCVDTIEPVFGQAVPLRTGEPVTLELDTPLPDALTLSLSEEVFGGDVVTEGVPVGRTVEWSPSVPPGDYVLHAAGSWPQGDVTYWFYISVP